MIGVHPVHQRYTVTREGFCIARQKNSCFISPPLFICSAQIPLQESQAAGSRMVYSLCFFSSFFWVSNVSFIVDNVSRLCSVVVRATLQGSARGSR